MENTTHPEQEIEKNEDLGSETASVQDQPQSETENQSASDDVLKKVQDELAESKDKYIRLYAEFDNHRRRTAKEKLDMIQSANEQLLKALLPVLDDFERAEKSFKDKNDKEAEGFFLIQNKFKKIIDQYSVKEMESKGSEFNPDFHEAITQIPAPEEKLKGKVVDVVEKGYLLGEKVLRFAKVVVGS
ncbi:MAG: nucleotide exchange factor GrpE [Azospira oryzae]|jgi:molecular chaperone GrpE|nr:MAG: nucleotide exchange factor GrpE [Azospira oryzae]